MTRHILHLCSLVALLSGTGCALTLGSGALVSEDDETFRIQSTGIGVSQTEAERDAWHEAAFRLRAMGYNEFRLDQTSMSVSGRGTYGEGQPQHEVKVSYQVSEARRTGGSGCACDLTREHHGIQEN